MVGNFHPAVEASALGLSAAATGVGMLGILLAYICYIRMPGLPMIVAWRAKSIYQVLLDKYYVDELYDLIITRPLFFVSNEILNRFIDRFVIDGTVNGVGTSVRSGSQLARRSETGNVQHYAFVYVLGVLGVVAYYLYLVRH